MLSTAAGAGIAAQPAWERARIGDRLAAFGVLLPAHPAGLVVLALGSDIADCLKDLYDDVLVLRTERPDLPRDAPTPRRTAMWDGRNSPVAPGSAMLLIIDSRRVSLPALRPALSPKGTLVVLGERGDYVIYPSVERPEHVWRRAWPLPARPGLRAQVRRSVGLRTSGRRGVPRLDVSGAPLPAIADLVVADLAEQTGQPGRVIGIEAAGHTILRVRQADGDVAVRLSLSNPGSQVTVGGQVATQVPAVCPYVLTELARGTTLGRPWVATRWLPPGRRSLADVWRPHGRRWDVAMQLAEALQTVRTGATGPGWARSWCDATALLPVETRVRFADVLAPLEDSIPTAWCHGDPWPSNVLIDRHSAGVIDWENATPDAPQGIDWLLIAILREVSSGRTTAAQACARLINGDLTVDRPVAGRPFGDWDADRRTALVVAAFVLHMRNRSLYGIGAVRLRRELDTMTAAIDAVPGRPAGIDSADPPNAGRAARGAAWLGLGAVVVKGAQTVVLLVLAALLAPSALGLIAIGTVITNIAQALSDLGTNIALTYWRGDARRAARTALTITLVMNVLIAAVVWLAAPWLAQALHASADGTWVIRGLVSVLPFYGAAASSLELLRRDLAFARRILPDIVAAVVGAAVSIGLAVEGHGVAGLVAGQIVQGVLTLLLVWVVGEVIVPGWNRGDARGLLSYGGHLTAASLLQLALLNVDYLIVARVLGGTPLGQYSLAFRLAYLPYLNVAFVIAGAAFPYLCRLPENAVGRALQRVVADAMTLLIPLCLGIALFADQLELLGTKWHPAVAAVRWLALYGALLSAAQFVQTAFNSIGRPRTTMQLQLLHFVVLVPILVLVVHHGVTAVAVGQCLAVIVEVAVALGLARVHLAGLRLRQLAADLGPALLGAVCMTAVVLAVHHVLPATTVSVEGLAWVGVLGLGAYLTPVWLLGRANVVRLARLIARSS